MTSKIEWTGDTWNFIRGCTPVTLSTKDRSGCTNCYAKNMAWRLQGMEAMRAKGYDGVVKKDSNGEVQWTGKINFDPEALLKPLQRTKPETYFVESMGDLFHKDVQDDWLDQAFAIMALCPQHTFQVLTKRPERMAKYLNECLYYKGKALSGHRSFSALVALCDKIDREQPNNKITHSSHWQKGYPFPNVWLGTSIETQEAFEARAYHLQELKQQGWKTFYSCEPLLEPLSLNLDMMSVDLVITGYEHKQNMPDAREPASGEDAVRSLRDQCVAAGTKFFYKQKVEDGKKISLPELDGKVWSELP
jgi:protein gp37